MVLRRDVSINRRRVLGRAVAGLVGLSAGLVVPARAGKRLIATPRQARGPFYPVQWRGDIDNDLVRVSGEAAQALGQVVHIEGTVFDTAGKALANTVIEIWQVDANGIYLHPADNRGSRRTDPRFQGRGRTRTDRDGRYSFRTIRPVAYPGRTPHIHFRVAAPKRRQLTTQMYIDGEPQNARDGLLNSIRNPVQRAALIVKLEPIDHIERGALRGVFDIVLG